jgi:hypothetical protein
MLVVALATPAAFGAEAVVFVIAYFLVHALHLVLFAIAARDDPELRRAVLRWAPGAFLGPSLPAQRRGSFVDHGELPTDQAAAVGDWIKASGKNVTHIVATHGHGDHWFTAGILADRFDARVVASPGTIEQMHNNVAGREAVWDKGYPGQIPAVPRNRDPCCRQPHHPRRS